MINKLADYIADALAPQFEDLIERLHAAETRAERYREALERIADPAREIDRLDAGYKRGRTDALLPYEIARTALADPEQQ